MRKKTTDLKLGTLWRQQTALIGHPNQMPDQAVGPAEGEIFV